MSVDSKWLPFDIEKVTLDPIQINAKSWNHLVLNIDCIERSYTVILNGVLTRKDIPFNNRNTNDQIERIVFRTGPYRNYVPADYADFGIAAQSNFYCDDLPGSDIKAPLIVFNIDDIITKTKGE